MFTYEIGFFCFVFRALGQGAFGEVFQGFYRQRENDAVEMPVAVKVKLFQNMLLINLCYCYFNQATLDVITFLKIHKSVSHCFIITSITR